MKELLEQLAWLAKVAGISLAVGLAGGTTCDLVFKPGLGITAGLSAALMCELVSFWLCSVFDWEPDADIYLSMICAGLGFMLGTGMSAYGTGMLAGCFVAIGLQILTPVAGQRLDALNHRLHCW